MCGEKCEAYARIHGMVGSPPRMRGKALENGGGSLDVRITPAYAGKSMCHRTRCACPWDHPRVCGEKRKDRLDYYVPQGSPPRMRGKARPQTTRRVLPGITPAYAGKRFSRCFILQAG